MSTWGYATLGRSALAWIVPAGLVFAAFCLYLGFLAWVMHTKQDTTGVPALATAVRAFPRFRR